MKDRPVSRPAPHHAGFTLLEMIIAVSIMAVVATLALPLLGSDTHARIRAASVVLRSDIEYAQVMTCADPTDPVVVVFNADGKSYSLAALSDTTTPILRSDGTAYTETMGNGRLRSSDAVMFTLTDVPDNILEFNPQGGLADFTLDPAILLMLDTEQVRITIAPTTGTVSEAVVEVDDKDGREAESIDVIGGLSK